jgi:hypothetical protein
MNRLLLMAMLWSLTGCYVHVPVESQAPDPEVGREVRVFLSEPLDLDAGSVIIQGVTQVDGMLYDRTPDTLAVWAKWLRSQAGSRYYANGQVHFMDRQNVSVFEVRQLHAPRTVAALVGVLGVGAGVFAFTADLGGGGASGDPPHSDTQQRITAPIPLTGLPLIR